MKIYQEAICLYFQWYQKHPDIFVSFEEALEDGYFVGIPIDDSGQLGSEVSSMYDHTNLEEYLRIVKIYCRFERNDKCFSFKPN